MDLASQVAARIADAVLRRNRDLTVDALLKGILGLFFTFPTFGLFYWLGWFLGLLFAYRLNLGAWPFGAILSGIFLAVAIWSAWRRVNPLAGLKPLTEEQAMLLAVGQLTGMIDFSPRHASAGFAFVLIAGPANIFEGFGLWAHRLRANDALIAEAARLLVSCEQEFPAEQVQKPAAALLLRRLALIKTVPRASSAMLAMTDKGARLVSPKSLRSKKQST